MKAVSVSYFVRYEGKAASPHEFLAHYREKHVPLLARFPKIRRILLHTPTSWQDAYPIKPDTFAILVQMEFDSLADLEAAAGSEARADARRDFGEMPAFQGVVYHTAAVSEEVFSQ
jgi:uncharacterized protein (TIGR02118 family)